MSIETAAHGTLKERIGTVVSDKPDKTAIVMVENLVQHQRYKKYLRRRRKFHAHDPQNECRTGDRVRIVETRPLSKLKRWRVKEILGRRK